MKLNKPPSYESLRLRANLLWLGSFTLATILVWVGYSLYSVYSTSTIEPEVEALLTPLNPTLDQDALRALENRIEPDRNFSIIAEVETLDSLEDEATNSASPASQIRSE